MVGQHRVDRLKDARRQLLLLQQMAKAQHGLHGKRWSSSQGLPWGECMRLYERNEFTPWHDTYHLLKEHFLARLLGQRLKVKGTLVHRHFHRSYGVHHQEAL